jgi:hypothetical protein
VSKKHIYGKRLTYEDFEEIGTITKLPEVEREDYIKRHENFWKEDLKVAEKLLEISPRWALVAGYYAMHDFAKLFLAKKVQHKNLWKVCSYSNNRSFEKVCRRANS